MDYISKSVSKAEYDFYKNIIPAMDIIFDVGVRDDLVFHHINPFADIHLFEPDIKWAKYLKSELEKLNYAVKVNNFGLGSKEETKELHYRYGSVMKRDIPRFKDMHESYEIKTRTLDDYCKENKIEDIDYLKIDTEGYDFEVIKGSKEMLNKIRFIQFEHFPNYYNGESLDDIFNYFKGWNIYLIGGKPKNYLATKEKVNLKQVK